MKALLLLSGNADPRMVSLSRPRVFACLFITEAYFHYRMCWMLACWWVAGWLCTEPTWGQGGLQWAKANMLCWSLDSTGGPNSTSEVCAGCLDCSFGLANFHAKDPDMYDPDPRCFPTNKSSKNLEHVGWQWLLEGHWIKPWADCAGASQVASYQRQNIVQKIKILIICERSSSSPSS